MTIQDKILASRYRIIKNIGSGAFGVTFLAEDTNIPTYPKCVVKQLKPLVNDPDHFEQAKKLFEKEAATLAKVGNHSQIPYLKDYFEEGGDFYLVQDFVDGIPLNQEIKDGEQWSEQAVLKLLQDCLPLLEFIHSQKPPMIHRDIKPANLIRRHEDGKIVLVDFGAVKESFQTKLVQSTVAIGTRGYMPTEQIRGKPRPASDLFALGMVAIQAVTGVNPIDLPEDENGELVWQYQEDENGQLQPRITVSASLAEVLSKMICHEFKNRYQTAREVLEILENFSSQPQQNATSVILPETFDVTDSQATEGSIPPSPAEAETVKQNSVTSQPEQETVQQHSGHQNQSPSTASNESSSLNEQYQEQSPPSTQSSLKKRIVTSLQSPLVKNLGVVSIIIIVGSGIMYGLEYHKKQRLKKQAETLENDLNASFEKKNYQDCIDQAQTDSEKDNETIHNIKADFNFKCSSEKAESLAEDNQYAQAINTINRAISTIPDNSPVQEQAIQEKEELLQERLNSFEETLTSLLKKKEYQECIEKANTQLENETSAMKDVKVNFYGKCSLGLAKSDAKFDKYSEAIQRAEKIKEESKVYQEAQTKIKDWSNELLDKGISDYKENGKLESFKEAVDILSTSNPVLEQALQKKNELKDLHEKNEKLLFEAQNALKQKQWKTAKEKAKQLKKEGKGYNYWETEASSIITEANEGMRTARNIETNTGTTNTGTTNTSQNTSRTTGTTTRKTNTNQNTSTNTTSDKDKTDGIDLCEDEFNRRTGMATAGCE